MRRIMALDRQRLRQPQATNPRNITALKKRLAELNGRLGPTDEE
jgi:hypothetical protein